ncbi:MAG TPA: hypothetical protein VN605_12645 [Thermoanaerobaculia bacterium]|nr:hypothetical protein [Thermoanaerobaculia bacterium]
MLTLTDAGNQEVPDEFDLMECAQKKGDTQEGEKADRDQGMIGGKLQDCIIGIAHSTSSSNSLLQELTS